MGRREQFDEIVDAAYAAALEPDLWPEALVKLSDAVGATGATLEVIDPRRQALQFVAFGRLPDDRHDDYRQHYFHICPRIAPVARSRRHEILSDYSFMSEADMRRDPFYNEFLLPHGMRHFLSATLMRTPERSAHVAPQFSVKHGHPDEDEIAFLRAVTPHFERAVDVFLTLEAHRSRAEQAETLISDASAGVVLLDLDLNVTLINPAAERILAENADAISISRRRLFIRDERDRAALKGIVAATEHPATDTTRLNAPYKAFASRDGRPPLLITILPLTTGDLHKRVSSHAAVAVIIEDPTEPLPLRTTPLVESFHLTPTEAAVAIALADGATPAEIAAKRGVSMPTMRTHIARTLEKTGCRSIVELVRLLALAAAWR